MQHCILFASNKAKDATHILCLFFIGIIGVSGTALVIGKERTWHVACVLHVACSSNGALNFFLSRDIIIELCLLLVVCKKTDTP